MQKYPILDCGDAGNNAMSVHIAPFCSTPRADSTHHGLCGSHRQGGGLEAVHEKLELPADPHEEVHHQDQNAPVDDEKDVANPVR